MGSHETIKWGAATLSDLFEFERGKEKNMAALSCGEVALVSARKVNNGIKGFVDSPAKIIEGGNILTLNNDGDGGAGLAYYQSVDFVLDTHVTALHPKDNVKPEALLYMSASISKQHEVFGHGRSISLPRAHRIQSMFPLTASNEPDYDYMSDYICKQRATMLDRYKSYVKKRIEELGSYVNIPALTDKKWIAFPIVDLFERLEGGKGTGLNHLVKTSDGINYIGATNRNNGVLCSVKSTSDSQNLIQKGNCIGFIKNGNGSAGYAIYKQEDFVSMSDVIYGYASWLTLYTGLFFVAAQD